MKSAMLAAIVLLPITGISHAAEVIRAGPFSVDVSPALSVRCNGRTLFDGDRCLALQTLTKSPPLVDTNRGEIVRAGNAFTLLAARGRNRFRREVLVTPGSVEITFALKAIGPTGGTHLIYDLMPPAGLLEECGACEATSGEQRAKRTTKPVAFDMRSVAPAAYHLVSLVYLSLPAVPCTLDFHPRGSWIGEGNYGESKGVNTWHDGQRWHFSAFCSGAREGAIFTGKIVVRPGTPPYDDFHDRRPCEYTTDLPVVLALNFSENDGDGRYRACPVPVPAGKPYRWDSPSAARIVTRGRGGLLYRDFAEAAVAGGAAEFQMKQRSGLYLLTLNVCDPEAATGPFSVAGPEGPLAEGITLSPGQHWVKSFPLRFRDGTASLRLSGKWKINALALQAILYEAEDYLFDRPFWTMKHVTLDGNVPSR